ncbi:metalloregulator ArsR/SmtB family transcription factor [Marinobacter zhejiangensis]|uniref:Transcriptional regulator, ArsR family n=1 Tax=Marinobacter zhejiangensis TaxID=488535 RepID=A0A1I4LFG3_9GAMM|nr:metalloregulator ArsR/SmtB family transcription factor [Marinobacter zhejiangensis]SFL89586.1 transcriptional regulator, ArsR family [Marinobacter zhejiangensis]
MQDRRRVLFVCSANSARSLIAEACLKQLAEDQFEVASAGTKPTEPHPLALQCLQEEGVDTSGLSSQPLAAVAGQPWDYVILLCDKAADECLNVPLSGQVISWDFPDPATTNRLATFAMVMHQILERVKLFVTVHQKVPPLALHTSPASLFKLLGDENRLAIALLLVSETELCVCEFTDVLELSQPRVSRLLAQLRDQALVADERRGQWVYYQLHPALPEWIRQVLDNTYNAHQHLIAPMLDRLHNLADRPDRRCETKENEA